MPNSIIKKTIFIFLVIIALYFGKEFLIPIAIGAILATLFIPLCNWMEQKNIPRILSVLLSFLILLIFFLGIFSLIGWQIASLTNDISLIKQRLLIIIEQSQQFIFNHFGLSTSAQSQLIRDQQNTFTSYIETIASSLVSIFKGFVLTLLYVILFLYYRIHIKNFLLKFSSDSEQDEAKQLIYKATNISQQYLLGLSKMIFCLWIMYGIGFSIIGVKNAIFFAILCGFLEIVPFIGNLTGTIITVLVASLHGASFSLIGGIIITYGIVQFIQGWILEPLILGPQVKINPLFTIIALVLGEIIWGIPGIVLAIPLTAILKIICDHTESLKPYGFLIGEIKMVQETPKLITKIKKLFHIN